MEKNQFVVKTKDGWAVKGANNKKATAIVDTQKEAINIARTIAKNQHSELRIHDRHGKFRRCDSYGNDSCPPKDKNY